MTNRAPTDDVAATADSRADASRVLWAQPAQRTRGPRPRHSLDDIAAAAITLADDEGLDALTMQRVAERLGVAKMALYRYVSSRAELDAVILDRVLGEPEEIDGTGWRALLTGWATAIYTRVLPHPWGVELAQRPHTPGPNELTWFEAGLGAMSDLPLRGSEKLDLLALLVGHVMSLVRQGAGTTAPEETLAAGLAPILVTHADDYPHTAAAFAEAGQNSARDNALSFGVDRVLDGIAALVTERGASSLGT